MSKVRDVLKGLNPTRRVNIVDIDFDPLEEGPAAGLLAESMYLDSAAIYIENDFPYLIVVGESF